MASFGDAVTIYELGVRIASFINDLRHAQDDFLGLRAEAMCLQICINSLGSESCQDALYHYISAKQREDLEQIIENTKINMQDLNEFIGSCKALVEKDAKAKARTKGLLSKWKQFIKEAWATYKFAMTDPQPFRDKLALPTASINIFLTSMTHVGLANVGSLLTLTGNALPAIPNASSATASTKLVSWEVIGQKVAFKRLKAADRAGLTVALEDEIVRYAHHLLAGGLAFDAKEPEAKSKIGRTKSVSKENDTFILRKKSTQVPASSARRLEFIEDDAWSSGRRRPLRIEASSPGSTPRIVHAEPNFETEPSSRPRQQRAFSEAEMGGHTGSGTAADRNSFRMTSNTPNSRGASYDTADLRGTRHACKREVEEQIKREQKEAAAEIENQSRRRTSARRASRRTEYSRLEPERRDESEDDEEEEMTILLLEEYGVEVIKLEDPRPTVDNGTVSVTVPATLMEPGEEPEVETQSHLPKSSARSRLKSETSVGYGPRRTSSSRYRSRFTPYDRYPTNEYIPRQTYTRPQRYEQYSLHASSSDDHEGISRRSHEHRPRDKRRSAEPSLIDEHSEMPGHFPSTEELPTLVIDDEEDEYVEHKKEKRRADIPREREIRFRESPNNSARETQPRQSHNPAARQRGQGHVQHVFMRGARSEEDETDTESDSQDDDKFRIRVRH